MGTVLKEVADLFPNLKFETVYVEVQVEEANHYKVKINPTIIFADENDNEIYRLEGFHETNMVKEVIEKIDNGEIKLTQELGENNEIDEMYEIYLLRDGIFSKVDVVYNNRTSIKAPRITAINELIKASQEGYINPFSLGTTLELVQFQNNQGIITLNLTKDVNKDELELMKEALQLTLAKYGIENIEISKKLI